MRPPASPPATAITLLNRAGPDATHRRAGARAAPRGSCSRGLSHLRAIVGAIVHPPPFPSPEPAQDAHDQAATGPPADRQPPRRRPVLEVTGSVVEEGFLRRIRTLLRTAPVHRLAAITGWRDWSDAPYDPRVLAQAIIDAVVARTGFANQLTYDDAISALAALAHE